MEDKVANYVAAESRLDTLPIELASLISSHSSVTLLSLVKSCGPYLTGEHEAQRSTAIALLAATIDHLEPEMATRQEVRTLTDFFTAETTLESGRDACFRAYRALSRMNNFGVGDATQCMKT